MSTEIPSGLGNCPACGSTEASDQFCSVNKDYSLAGYDYLKCKECLSIYLNDARITSQDILTELHVKHWYTSGNFSFCPERSIEEQFIHASDYGANILHSINSRPKHVLDIGCGNGELVAYFHQNNIQAFGIEPSENAFGILSTRPDLKNYFAVGGIENLEALHYDHRFDLITMFDVLEHLYDPLESLEKLRDHVLSQNNGILYVTVPSGSSLQIKALREYSWNFMAPFHRSLFSESGLTALLKRSGAKEIVKHNHSLKNWGWTRGFAWRAAYENNHAQLRKCADFRRFDYLIDDYLDTLAHELEAPSSLVYTAYY